MHITPISYLRNSGKAQSTPKPDIAYNVMKYHSLDAVSFSGIKPNPDLLKNQLKILLTQDIWAEKLNIKMPESELEKSVLLEILNMRKNLDRYTRLTNERLRIILDVRLRNELLQTNPNSPQIQELEKDIAKRGNIAKVISTLDKQIDLEKNKNKQAIDYFKNIERMEEEYLQNRQIKSNMMAKFWDQVRKNNINKDHKYSTQDLIDIVSGKKDLPKAENIVKTAKPEKLMTKRQILSEVQKKYEAYLRKNINIYTGNFEDAIKGCNEVINLYKQHISKYPDFGKQVVKALEEIRKKYNFKVERLGIVDIYDVGKAWKEMEVDFNEIKALDKVIKSLKATLAENSSNKDLNKLLLETEEKFANLKTSWTKDMQESVSCEAKNRIIFSKNGVLDAYDYLTGANKDLLCYKELNEICKRNNGVLPEEKWEQLLNE